MPLNDDQRSTWYPVAASSDLVPRHIFHGMLWGQELAIWRADDGHVNIWENRCLHRGVRLTIGVNLGFELMCQYHGWRYANRTAGCTYIPAHPADAPARTVCNRTYPVIERAGLIWTALNQAADPQAMPDLPDDPLALRAVEVRSTLELTGQALSGIDGVSWHLQPADANRCIIRGLIRDRSNDAPSADARSMALDHDHRLQTLRDRLEASAADLPDGIEPEFGSVAAELATMPDRRKRRGALTVKIAAKYPAGRDIMAFELEPVSSPLPSFQPGAHLDLHLPGGLIRQYSITNGPGQTEHYTIAVKREDTGKGGSKRLHDHLNAGDLLSISEPRNNFPLRRDQHLIKLIAGGIGITPLIAMARTLAMETLPYELHVFARSIDDLPLPQALEPLGSRVTRHLGLDPAQSRARFEAIIDRQGEKHALYVCGPPLMLDAVRQSAASLGWDEDDVHFEYFANDTNRDLSKPFEVALARSAVSINVKPGQSIVDALRGQDIDIPTSCEKGACGTCRVTVLDGEIDHQDVYLSDAEKSRGDCMMACVSRATSDRLVLDL